MVTQITNQINKKDLSQLLIYFLNNILTLSDNDFLETTQLTNSFLKYFSSEIIKKKTFYFDENDNEDNMIVTTILHLIIQNFKIHQCEEIIILNFYILQLILHSISSEIICKFIVHSSLISSLSHTLQYIISHRPLQIYFEFFNLLFTQISSSSLNNHTTNEVNEMNGNKNKNEECIVFQLFQNNIFSQIFSSNFSSHQYVYPYNLYLFLLLVLQHSNQSQIKILLKNNILCFLSSGLKRIHSHDVIILQEALKNILLVDPSQSTYIRDKFHSSIVELIVNDNTSII